MPPTAPTPAATAPRTQEPSTDAAALWPVLDDLPAWVAGLDQELRHRYVNTAYATAAGRPAADLLGRTVAELYGPAAAEHLRADLQTALAGQTRRFAGWSPGPDGARHYVERVCRPWVAAEGRIAGVFLLLRDRSEEVRLDQARRRLLAELQAGIDCIDSAFGLYDADERLQLCNTAYARMYDSTREDLQGITAEALHDFAIAALEELDGVPVADPQAVKPELLARMRRGDGSTSELKTAGERWFLCSPRRTATGGIAFVRSEITDLKHAEARLQESEARFRSIAEAHPVPVVIADLTDGAVRYASPACEGLLGRPPKTIRGSRIADWAGDRTQRRRLVAAFRRQGGLDGAEVGCRRGDGGTIPVAVTARAIRYDGRDCAAIGLVDLSEQKAAQAEIVQQREALHQSEKLNALGALLAGIAHELNNPLSVVVGQALMLREHAGDPATAERARRIGAAADRCARIVRSFLAMARRQPAEHAPVALNDVVQATLELTAYMLRSSDVAVSTDLADGLPPVSGDRDQLMQVLMNLVVNAQQAMLAQEGPRRLEILTRYDPIAGCVRVKVKDTGPGVVPDARGRIFEPFYTTKPVGAGTGVGLALSRGIVDSHGGTIRLEEGTAAAAGASFVVDLPAAPEDVLEMPAACTGSAPARPCRILLVDDEPEILTVLRDILTAAGHEVITAGSGAQGLEALRTQAPLDAVLSDLRMPGVDGAALYRALQDVHPDLAARVAFITGDTLGAPLQGFLAATGAPRLDKPFTPEEVRRLVRQLLQPATAG